MNVTKNLTTLRRVKIHLRIPVQEAAEGALTLSGVVATDPCSVAGVSFVADTDYDVGASDAETATNLAAAISENATCAALLDVDSDGAVVSFVSIVPGLVGNQIALVGSTHITATPMAGGEGTQSTTAAEEDEELTTLITSACSDFAEAVGFDPNEQASLVVYDFQARKVPNPFFLPDLPNAAITSVELNDESIDEAADPNSDGWWMCGKHQFRINGATWLSYNHLEVTYTYGYDPIPEDIVQAVTLMACSAWKMRDHIGERSSSSPDGISTTYLVDVFGTEAGPLASVAKTIDRYKRLY